MRIIVIGAGEVAFHLAKRLLYENHDLMLIDMDPNRVDSVLSHDDWPSGSLYGLGSLESQLLAMTVGK